MTHLQRRGQPLSVLVAGLAAEVGVGHLVHRALDLVHLGEGGGDGHLTIDIDRFPGLENHRLLNAARLSYSVLTGLIHGKFRNHILELAISQKRPSQIFSFQLF